MKIRSYDDLDFPLAWQRILRWVGQGQLDVPDRLPFEVLKRLFGTSGPIPRREQHLQPITVVFSPKKSATSRPLVRLSPRDLILYQALVDRLAADVEAALAPRDVVFAYRQTLGKEDDAFAGSPTREQYADQVQKILLEEWDVSYALTGDVAGFFLHINIDELERVLLAASPQVDVVRDLADLLRAWETLGVRGLPQGIRASSPLGNLYLAQLDVLLTDQGCRYVRWMDDWIIVSRGFHEARRIQDEMERHLFDLGLTLAADKTRIVGWSTAAHESKGARRHLAEMKAAQREAAESWIAEQVAVTGYPAGPDDMPDPDQLDREVVVSQFDQLLKAAEQEHVPKEAHSMGVAVFRDMQTLEEPRHLDQIPALLMRLPSLTRAALDYVASVSRKDISSATAVYQELLDTRRFMSDVEKLNVCFSILKLPERQAIRLSDSLATWALTDPSELVRARAVLAWGAQSPATRFDVADKFWNQASPPWQPYALIAIQNKAKPSRDSRYERWGGEGRFTGALAAQIKKNSFGWRKL
jgi:Reverse transcriptase (RNA-dependent DNA polymerase)